MKTGIYTITNIIDNKIYVGSTTINFTDRFSSHKRQLRKGVHRNTHLQNAYNKYGEVCFIFEILEECLPEYCQSQEQYWINLLDACNKNFGYNLVARAGLPPNFLKGRSRPRHLVEALNFSNRGRVQSKEERQFRSERLKGKTKTEEHIRNAANGKKRIVLQLTDNEEVIKEWSSVTEAAQEYGWGVSNVVRGVASTAGGYKWKLKK